MPPAGPAPSPFDFAALDLTGALPVPAPLPAPAAAPPSPFEFAALEFAAGPSPLPAPAPFPVPAPVTAAPTVMKASPSAPSRPPAPSGPSAVGRAPPSSAPPRPPPSGPPAASRPPPQAPPPAAGFDFAALSAPPGQGELPAWDAAMPPGLPAFPGAPMPGAGAGRAAGVDDFFGGSLPTEPPRALPSEGLSMEAARRELFDAPPARSAAPPPPQAPPVGQPAQPVARPPAGPSSAEGPPAAPAPAPPTRRRTALGVVGNLLSAALLVGFVLVAGSAYLREGRVSLDTLSVEQVKATFSPTERLVAGDISNGLYSTSAGRAVFYVRGEVTNRGPTAARVVVKAELLEGATVVRGAEAAAGAPPSPEELFLLANDEALATLNARVAQRAPPVEPGETAPFIVTFFEYPPDLEGFRVRVSGAAVEAPPPSLEP